MDVQPLAEYLSNTQVLWKKCLKVEKCIKIIIKKICIKLQVCLSIIFDNGNYYVEVDANGKRFKFKISKQCYTIFSIAVGHIEICLEPRPHGVHIELKACIAVAGCFKVYGVNVDFPRISTLGDVRSLTGMPEFAGIALDPDEHLVIVDEYHPLAPPAAFDDDD